MAYLKKKKKCFTWNIIVLFHAYLRYNQTNRFIPWYVCVNKKKKFCFALTLYFVSLRVYCGIFQYNGLAPCFVRFGEVWDAKHGDSFVGLDYLTIIGGGGTIVRSPNLNLHG